MSSESDEESGSRVEGASASSSAPAEVTKAQPTSGPPAGAATTKESGRSPESSGCVVLSKECPGGTDGRQNKEVCHERNVSRTGRGAPRGEGNRQRPKSTWQVGRALFSVFSSLPQGDSSRGPSGRERECMCACVCSSCKKTPLLFLGKPAISSTTTGAKETKKRRREKTANPTRLCLEALRRGSCLHICFGCSVLDCEDSFCQ